MKILLVSQYFWPENFRINEIAKFLISKGYNVEVLTGKPNYPLGDIYNDYLLEPDKFKNYFGINIYRLNIRPRKDGNKLNLFLNYSSFLFRSILFSLLKLRNKNYDIIFTFGTSPVTTSITSILLSKFTGSKTVLWVLDLWPEIVFELNIIKNNFIKKYFSKLMNSIYNNTDLILAQSPKFQENIERKLKKKENIKILYQWPENLEKKVIDKKILKNFDDENLNLVFTGNIGTAQNFEHIIQVANLCESMPVKWHIVGTGRDLHNIISKNKISKNILFYGSRDKSEMFWFLDKADALLISLKGGDAINSTIPGKLQTYLLANKKILGSISGEAARIIKENNIGFVSEPGDEETFISNIKKLYEQKKEKKLEVDNSRIIETFNKNRILHYLEKELLTLVNKKFSYIKMIKSVDEIDYNKNFILSAINLAFLGYYGIGKIKINSNSIFWPDGVFYNKLSKDKTLKKIPGREIIDNLKIPEEIKKIHVIGNLSKKGELYLKKKYPKKLIKNTSIPYGKAKDLANLIDKLDEDEITIINLPTPKQEEIAKILSSKNKKFRIFCTGGAIGMLCGDEPPVPQQIYSLGFEFLWRLRFDTKRRVIRLIETFYYYIISEIRGKFKNIKIKTEDER